jgi:hypothetical protein
MPPALFALVIFQISLHIYAQVSLDCIPPIYASHLATMTGVHLSMGRDEGLKNLLLGLALYHDSPSLPLPRSQDYRHDHCTWSTLFRFFIGN